MARTRTSTASPNKAATAGKPRGSRSTATTRKAIPEHERHRRIAEAAYYRAQQRGFQGGDPLEDWLVAEAEFEHGNGRGTRARR